MKKLMLTLLAIGSLQQMPIYGASYATMAMGALKAYAPKIIAGLGVSAAGFYADYQAKQLATQADLKIANLAGNLQDQFKQSANQANAYLDGGIKKVSDQLVETNKHVEQVAQAAHNAVEVGAFGVNAVNQKMNQASGLAHMVLVAAIANPAVQKMFGMHITPEMYKAFGLQVPTPLKWYERLWRGAVDLTIKTVNDTAMHIFSQIISRQMIGMANRVIQSPQQQQLQTVPEQVAGAAIANNQEEQAARSERGYRAPIRRRR